MRAWWLGALALTAGCPSDTVSNVDARNDVYTDVTPPDAPLETDGSGEVPTPRAQSTFERLDAARAAGTLDDETTLVYKVFAVFGDPRLPPAYLGDDTGIVDTLVLSEVARRFDALSGPSREVLAPFLVPPIYANSWYALRETGAARASAPVTNPPVCGTANPAWAAEDGAHARVWYEEQRHPGDKTLARAIANEIDARIWPALVDTLKMRAPPPDDGVVGCHGGTPLLDLYLVDHLAYGGECRPYDACKATPSYILLKRRDESGTVPTSMSTVAHEVFHALQFAYDECMKTLENAWWVEGTASWAQDYVYGRDDQQEQTKAFDFLIQDRVSLDRSAEYGVYVFPFWATHHYNDPGIVRRVWEKIGPRPILEVLDEELPDRFQGAWHEFALQTVNVGPAAKFTEWDDLPFQMRPSDGATIALGAKREFTATIAPIELPYLSYAVYRFGVHDLHDRIRSLMLTMPLRDEPHVKVQALLKLKDGTWQPAVEDWSTLYQRFLCRDRIAERVDEVLVVISNSQFQDREAIYRTPAPLAVAASDIGCWRWTGTVTGSLRHTFDSAYVQTDNQVDVSVDVAFEAQPIPADASDLPEMVPVSGTLRLASMGNEHFTEYSCQLREPETSSNILFGDGLLRINFVTLYVPELGVYTVRGASESTGAWTSECSDPSHNESGVSSGEVEWLSNGGYYGQFRVQPDGVTISDEIVEETRSDESVIVDRWTWHLKAERE